MLAYMFDLVNIMEELLSARARGCSVLVGVNRYTNNVGTCTEQPAILQRLHQAGVVVVLIKGSPLKEEYKACGRTSKGGTGLQHAKVLLVDDRAIFGSTNFTVCSRAHCELSGLFHIGPGDLKVWRGFVYSILHRGVQLEYAGRQNSLQRNAATGTATAVRRDDGGADRGPRDRAAAAFGPG